MIWIRKGVFFCSHGSSLHISTREAQSMIYVKANNEGLLEHSIMVFVVLIVIAWNKVSVIRMNKGMIDGQR